MSINVLVSVFLLLIFYLTLFFIPYLIGTGFLWIYRRLKGKLGKTVSWRPLTRWEQIFRRLSVGIMLVLYLSENLLAEYNLSFRPNLAFNLRMIFVSCFLFWFSLVLVRFITKSWEWAGYIVVLFCMLPFAFFVVLLGSPKNYAEYDFVVEDGKTYLHTSETASWSKNYVHKYEVVNDYLMKTPAVDYDIHQLSEYYHGISYEEQFFINEDN